MLFVGKKFRDKHIELSNRLLLVNFELFFATFEFNLLSVRILENLFLDSNYLIVF